MKNSFILGALFLSTLAVACGGDSEGAKSADDAASSERAAERAEDKADAAAEKADAAADKAEGTTP